MKHLISFDRWQRNGALNLLRRGGLIRQSISRQISNDSSRFCSICSRTPSNTARKTVKLQSPTDLPAKARCELLSPTWVWGSPVKNCRDYLPLSTDWVRSNRRSREPALALLFLRASCTRWEAASGRAVKSDAAALSGSTSRGLSGPRPKHLKLITPNRCRS